jgi:colanic acid/amylovoran biosynthesis glycosyltransferase
VDLAPDGVVRDSAKTITNMIIAYIVGTYPCPSEQFLQRELQAVIEFGQQVTICAARHGPQLSCIPAAPMVIVRPRFWAPKAVAAVLFALRHNRAGLGRLVRLWLKWLGECPSEALRLLANLGTICYFAGRLRETHADRLHAAFLSWPGMIAVAVGALMGIPISMAGHARDLYVEAGAITLKARASTLITTCTRQAAQDLRNLLPQDDAAKVHVVRHGLDVRECNHLPAMEHARSTHVIFACGRLVEKKGFDCLLKAFAVLKQRISSRMVIVGEGTHKRGLQRLAQSLDIDKDVKFIEWLEQDSLIPVLRSASVVVVPSVIAKDGDRDGLPNVILEAFSCGVPVVASNLPAIAEAVDPGITGLLATPADEKQLADEVEHLLRDAALRERLVRGAFRYLTKQHDLRRNASRFLELLEGDAGRVTDLEPQETKCVSGSDCSWVIGNAAGSGGGALQAWAVGDAS